MYMLTLFGLIFFGEAGSFSRVSEATCAKTSNDIPVDTGLIDSKRLLVRNFILDLGETPSSSEKK